MEEKVLKVLKFLMNPPTLYNYLMATLRLLQSFREKEYMVVLDLLDERNYEQYRQLVVLLDLVLLNMGHLEHDK